MRFFRHFGFVSALALGALVATGCSRNAGTATAAPPVMANWMTDFAAAQAKAKTENRMLLLEFTGSDWCVWCIKMHEDALDTQAFKDYADQNLVLVELDFPLNKTLPDALVKQNNDLKGKYQVEGFPTFVVLGPDGAKLAELVGYQKGGPEAFIAQLKKLAPKA